MISAENALLRISSRQRAKAGQLIRYSQERDVGDLFNLGADERSAVISACGIYRYRLERFVAQGNGRTMAVIMVNPSTADATKDDATIRKVRGFAERHFASKVIVGNLFAYRATDVRELRTAEDPIGPDNDVHLEQIMLDSDIHLVAWGPVAKLPRNLRTRWRVVAAMANRVGATLRCLGAAQDGQPFHPLMLPYNTALAPWSPPSDQKR